MRSNTSDHWPKVGWRKSRIVGYQGESSRSRSQRQSGDNCSANQTGAPRAPARWAIAVSARDHQVEIADHGRGVHERAGRFVQPIGKIENRKIDRCDLLRSKSLLQADQLHAGQAGQRRKTGQGNRTPTIATIIARALPDDADLEAVDCRPVPAATARSTRDRPTGRELRREWSTASVPSAPGR